MNTTTTTTISGNTETREACPAWCFGHADGDGPDGSGGTVWHEGRHHVLNDLTSEHGHVSAGLEQQTGGAAPGILLGVGDDENRMQIAHVRLTVAQAAFVASMLADLVAEATDGLPHWLRG